MELQRPFFVAGGLAFLSGGAALIARAQPDVVSASSALSMIAVVSLCGAAICFGRNLSGTADAGVGLDDASLALAQLPQDVLILNRKDLSLIYLNAAAAGRFGLSAQDGFGQALHRVLSGARYAPLRAQIKDFQTTPAKSDQEAQLSLGAEEQTVMLSRTDDAIVVVIKEVAAPTVPSDTLVSTVSHELRSPLTAIKGSLGLMLAGTSDDLPANVRNLAEMALRNTDRLVTLTDDILDHQKIAAGQLAMDMAPTDLAPLVRESCALIAVQAQAAGVRCVVDSADAPLVSQTDAHRVTQVLVNLLTNAIKFSPKGGTITVRLTRDQGTARIAVCDEGAGVPLAEQAKLFAPYADLENSDRAHKGGTGLGLSISKALVERLGGEIGYQGRESHGAEFHFTLPLLTQGHVMQKNPKRGLTPA